MTGTHGAWLRLLIDVLAAYRLTRLVVEDSFPPIQALRDAIERRHVTYDDQGVGRADSWAELVTCPWCAGMYVCGGVIALTFLAPRLWWPLSLMLAFSAVVGLVASELDT